MDNQVLSELSERIQDDITCILDGIDEDTLNNVLNVVVERINDLKEQKIYCYKVVQCIRNGFFSCSTIVTKLAYVINHITRPQFGKIFVFQDLSLANKFIDNMNDDFVILKCECGTLSPIKERLSTVYTTSNDIRVWWKSINNKNFTKYYTPEGTYGTDWVKPIEVVE